MYFACYRVSRTHDIKAMTVPMDIIIDLKDMNKSKSEDIFDTFYFELPLIGIISLQRIFVMISIIIFYVFLYPKIDTYLDETTKSHEFEMMNIEGSQTDSTSENSSSVNLSPYNLKD